MGVKRLLTAGKRWKVNRSCNGGWTKENDKQKTSNNIKFEGNEGMDKKNTDLIDTRNEHIRSPESSSTLKLYSSFTKILLSSLKNTDIDLVAHVMYSCSSTNMLPLLTGSHIPRGKEKLSGRAGHYQNYNNYMKYVARWIYVIIRLLSHMNQ